MSKPLVLVTAPVQTRSGYGNHPRDICRALIESDKYDVKIQSVRWGNTPPNALEKDNPHHNEIEKRILRQPSLEKQPDLHFHIVVPNEFQPIAKKNVGITAGIEHTVPPAEWVDGMNRMDLNILTSEFAKTGFENIKYDKMDERTKQKLGVLQIEKPMEVLFEGADTEIYKETKKISNTLNEKFSKIDDNFCFLFVGHWLQGNIGEDRKDAGMMLRTFFEAFKNKRKAPALILKTSGAGFSIIDRNEILKRIEAIRNSIDAEIYPNVYLLHGDLTDEEMNELYNHPKVKAHLTFTHGEGFGRPLLEASFSGKPIIAPIATGQADFLSKTGTIELPHTMTKVPENAFPPQYNNPEALWATVQYPLAVKIIRDVYDNYNKYTLRAKKQMIINRQQFSFDAMKEKLENIVDNIIKDIPKEIKLKLPELKKD